MVNEWREQIIDVEWKVSPQKLWNYNSGNTYQQGHKKEQSCKKEHPWNHHLELSLI